MKKILITEIHIPPISFGNGFSLESLNKPKDRMLLEWLINWVEDGLKKGLFDIGDLIPSKKDLAKYHNVSTGTMQNAVRYAEDLGYFTSRQCVGTMIADKTQAKPKAKATSKKDAAVLNIKKYIIKNKFKKGDVLPASRIIAAEVDTSQNTVRLALDILTREGILTQNGKNANKPTKSLLLDYKEVERNFDTKDSIKSETLSKKLYSKIKKYIIENYQLNDKIMPNEEFAKMFNVSVRTINDAMKRLNKEKIILSLRGRYGTRYINEPDKLSKQKEAGEKSRFMSRTEGKTEIKNSYLYSWQRVLDQIKKYMVTNHEAGDKLPSMKELACTLNVSANTIRRAVSELTAQGILYCERGKHGGIYIVEMPAKEDAFTWLALNPKFLVQ